MNRFFIVALLVALLLLGSAALSASEPKTIPEWPTFRQDMEMVKGSLESIADRVMATYLPDYGMVFMCSSSFKELNVVKPKLERALHFIAPIITSLPAGAKLAIVYYSVPGDPDWELTYVSKADTSANPETWDVYLNVAPE